MVLVCGGAGSPLLIVSREAMNTMNIEDPYFLWIAFSRSRELVEDGPRLENISWRMWSLAFSSRRSRKSAVRSLPHPQFTDPIEVASDASTMQRSIGNSGVDFDDLLLRVLDPSNSVRSISRYCYSPNQLLRRSSLVRTPQRLSRQLPTHSDPRSGVNFPDEVELLWFEKDSAPLSIQDVEYDDEDGVDKTRVADGKAKIANFRKAAKTADGKKVAEGKEGAACSTPVLPFSVLFPTPAASDGVPGLFLTELSDTTEVQNTAISSTRSPNPAQLPGGWPELESCMQWEEADYIDIPGMFSAVPPNTTSQVQATAISPRWTPAQWNHHLPGLFFAGESSTAAALEDKVEESNRMQWEEDR